MRREKKVETLSSKKYDWSFFDYTWSYLNYDEETELDKEFKKCNNRGERFEVFINYLLNNVPIFCQSHKWERTPKKTHDGKKDFEGYNANKEVEIWGECKNYSSLISINVLSPTLVMSVIDGIKTVYIFSLNKVNRTFKSYIKHFSDTSHKNVVLYEDDYLEFITRKYLKSIPEVTKFIRGVEPCGDLKEPPELDVAILNMHMKELIPSDGPPQRICLNECCILSVTIYNKNTSEGNYQFHISGGKYFVVEVERDLLNQSTQHELTYNMKVDEGEIRTIFVFCRLVMPPHNNTVVPVPKIKYRDADNQSDAWNCLAVNQKISVNKTYYVPLLQYSLSLKTKLYSDMINGNKCRVLIRGNSGTGKSRLLYELYSDLMGYYQKKRDSFINVVYIDADTNNNASKLIKRLLLGFAGLNYDLNTAEDNDGNEREVIPENGKHDIYLKSVNYIINLDENQIKDLTQTIIDILSYLGKSIKTVLFFDNLQFADKSTIEIIDSLDCDYVYTVNTDYITDEFESQIKNIVSNSKCKTLRAGKSTFVKDYLINTFNNKLTDLDLIYDKNKEYTPLYLYHYVQYLMEEGIIVYDNNKYIVCDRVKLRRCKEYLIDEADVIKNRIEFLYEKYDRSKLKVALSLMSVLGRVSIYHDFKKLNDAFNTLVLHNIAEVKSSNYLFTHQKISTVFREGWLKPPVWQETYTYLSKSHNSYYDAIRFIALFNSDMANNSTITHRKEVADNFFAKKLYSHADKQNLILIFKAVDLCVNFYIEYEQINKEVMASIIHFYSWYSLTMQRMYGFYWEMTHNEKMFDRIVTMFLNICFQDDGLNKLLYGVCREYFNRLLVKDMYSEAKRHTNQLIEVLKDIPNSDDKYFWLSMAYNRQSIALSATNDPEAEAAYNNAMLYAKNDAQQRNLANVYIDEGYRYYNDYRHYDREKVVKMFQEAILLNGNKRTCIEDYHEALIYVFNNEFEKANKFISDELLNDSDIYDYYKCKLNLLNVYLDVILYNKNLISHQKIEADLKKADEVISATGAAEMQFHIHFLTAKLNEIISPKKVKDIKIFYCLALESYCKTYTDIIYKEQHIPFYYAIIKKLHEYHFTKWNSIKNFDEIAKRLTDEYLANKYNENYFINIPQGLFIDPTTNEIYPNL